MKHLILSEGKNDTYFLAKAVEVINPSIELDILDIEDHSIGEQKPYESEVIRDFVPSYNPYSVLLKSEGGQNSLKKVFCSLISHLCSLNLNCHILVDLDGGSTQGYVSDLNERISRIHAGNPIRLNNNKKISESELMVTEEYSITSNEITQGDFCMLAFWYSLEDFADIDKGDPWEERKEKIDSVIDDERVTNPIQQTLF